MMTNGVDVSALRRAALIGMDDDWEAWFAAAGFPSPNAKASGQLIADIQTIGVASALAGQGVALGSPILFAPENASGRLVQPFSIAITEAGLWLTYPKARRRAANIAAFREWLLGAIAEHAALVA